VQAACGCHFCAGDSGQDWGRCRDTHNLKAGLQICLDEVLAANQALTTAYVLKA
jgi:hypothetical protein